MKSISSGDHNLDEVKIDANRPVFTTGVVCDLLGVPVWVLKRLDSEGIVSPPREREGTARLYSMRQLKVVRHCWNFISVHKVKITGLKVILKIEQGHLR
ncbi:MAG: MerR family transcriptional regulator [Candidatus Omnitrophica bacterium]|nr:MerR family transcriptional regulator [Candidatus Omnitrophota bacterium]